MKTMKRIKTKGLGEIEVEVVRVKEDMVWQHLKEGYVFCPKKDYKKTGTIK